MKTHAKRNREVNRKTALIKELRYLVKLRGEVSEEKLKSLEAKYNDLMEDSDFQPLRSPFDSVHPTVLKLLNAISYLEESRKTRRTSERDETC